MRSPSQKIFDYPKGGVITPPSGDKGLKRNGRIIRGVENIG